MEANAVLVLALILSLTAVACLGRKLYRVREQLSLITDALADMKKGNLNRRVLARESDMTKQICYDLNEIALTNQARLIQQKQAEQAYKRLMTSLSHDVKTPLASLVGYLEAVEKGLVTGQEKEEDVYKRQSRKLCPVTRILCPWPGFMGKKNVIGSRFPRTWSLGPAWSPNCSGVLLIPWE